MAKEPDTEVATKKIWGLSTETWVSLFQSLGVPTLFMVFVCWMAYQWLLPVAAAHIELLQRTGDTLESMDATLSQSNKMLEQLAAQSFPEEDWRDQIADEHKEAQAILEDIKAGVDKLNGAQ